MPPIVKRHQATVVGVHTVVQQIRLPEPASGTVPQADHQVQAGREQALDEEGACKMLPLETRQEFLR